MKNLIIVKGTMYTNLNNYEGICENLQMKN